MQGLEQALDRWVAAGLIERDQARAIAAAERHRADADQRRVSRTVEAVGYLGAVLAIVAAVLVLSDVWDQLQAWARVTVLGTVALGTLVGGSAVRTSAEPAFERLTSVLWTAAVLATAMTTGVLGGSVLDLDEAGTMLMAAAPATVLAAVLWRLRPRVLQHVVLFAGIVATVLSAIWVTEADLAEWAWGLIVYGIGLAWMLVSWGGFARPQTTGLVLGMLGLGVGASVASGGGDRGFGLVLGLVTSLALIGVSAVAQRTLVLGFGAVGVAVFLPQLATHWFGATVGAPLALFVAGLVLVVAALAGARMRSGSPEITEDGR